MTFEIYMFRGAVGGEGFLIKRGGEAMCVDSGFGFSREGALDDLKRGLGGDRLKYIFLTHSHYDHVLGSVAIKREFPEAPVVGSLHCAEIFTKPHALELMNTLDAAAAKEKKCDPVDDPSGGLRIDVVVNDGDRLFLDGASFETVALPGHTKCCVGLYCEEEKLLVSCETLGTYSQEQLAHSGCVSSAKATLESIDRALELDVEHLLIPHHGTVDGADEVRGYLKMSRFRTEERRDYVLDAYSRGVSMEDMIRELAKTFLPESLKPYYPLQAFITNTAAQIKLILKENAE